MNNYLQDLAPHEYGIIILQSSACLLTNNTLVCLLTCLLVCLLIEVPARSLLENIACIPTKIRLLLFGTWDQSAMCICMNCHRSRLLSLHPRSIKRSLHRSGDIGYNPVPPLSTNPMDEWQFAQSRRLYSHLGTRILAQHQNDSGYARTVKQYLTSSHVEC